MMSQNVSAAELLRRALSAWPPAEPEQNERYQTTLRYLAAEKEKAEAEKQTPVEPPKSAAFILSEELAKVTGTHQKPTDIPLNGSAILRRALAGEGVNGA